MFMEDIQITENLNVRILIPQQHKGQIGECVIYNLGHPDTFTISEKRALIMAGWKPARVRAFKKFEKDHYENIYKDIDIIRNILTPVVKKEECLDYSI